MYNKEKMGMFLIPLSYLQKKKKILLTMSLEQRQKQGVAVWATFASGQREVGAHLNSLLLGNTDVMLAQGRCGAQGHVPPLCTLPFLSELELKFQT